MRKLLIAAPLFLGASAFAAFTAYYGPDALTSINTTDWGQNGSLTATSSGLTSADANGGSLISKVTPAGPSQSQYEADITLTLTTSGGVFDVYLDASTNALSSPATASGTYYVFELAPTFSCSACSAVLSAYKRVSNTITSLSTTTVPCHNGTVVRAVSTSHSEICAYIDGAPYAIISDSSITSGLPGVGVRNAPAGNTISSVSLYPIDTTPPNRINAQTFGTSVFPNRVDLQWQPVTDDPNGSGIAYYSIRRGALSANVTKPEFSDETVSPGTKYTYNVWAVDYDQNISAIELVVQTPPANAIDPRRVGVRPTGSYWGGAGEQIDTLSGNLNYSTQLFKAMGRGGWGAGLNLSYNSQLWRQDPGGTWKLDDDVGYGLGWRLQAGAIVPFYSGYFTIDHYTFIDPTGAEYRLDQNNGGIWTSTQGIYVSYDSTVTPGVLHFRDGSFWTMGATSAGTEQDAGTMYPTVMEDSNGNQILLYYNAGLGVSFSNSCARFNYIEDVRAIPNPTTRQTYTFTYNTDAIPHLTQINNVLGNGSENYTLGYFENATLASPFSAPVSFGTTTMLQSIAVTNLGLSTSFTYDTTTNSGELTSMTTPYGGKIRWAYVPFTYSGTRTLREVGNRYLTTTSGGTETAAYVFTRPTGDSSLSLHSGLTIDDPSGIGEKAWTFATTGTAALLGTVTQYQDRPSSAQASSPLQSKTFTWVQDSLGNPYIGTVLTALNPTGANMQSKTTQTLDTNGNVLTSNIYDYPSLTTPARTYTNTYITDSHWTSYYINNRVLTSTVQNSSTPAITLVTNTYDPFPSNPGTMYEHDPFYNNTSFQYRGNVYQSTRAGSPMITTFYDVGGNPTSATDGTTTTAVSTSSTTNYAAPSVITPNSNSNLQTTASYTSWLSMSTVTGPNSTTASTVYDTYGRPYTSSSIYGAGTSYSYSNDVPYVITATTYNTNGTSHWTQTTLDGFGRAITVLRGTGGTTVSRVDTIYAPCACSPTGKVQKVSQPYVPGNTPVYTTYTYDGMGRTLSVLLPDGASSTSYAYSGNTTTITDPAGKWKMQTMDAMGDLIQVTEPNPAGGANYVTQYTYDLLSHLTQVSMTRPSGTQTRTFAYDSNQRLLSETHPESGSKIYTYNTDGTLASRTDAKGITTKYTYDTYKRLTMKSYWYMYNGVLTEDTTQRLTLTYDTNPLNSTYSQNSWGRLTTAQWNYPTGRACGAETGASYYMYSYTTAGEMAGKTLDITRNTDRCGYGYTWQHLDFAGSFTYDNEGHMLSMTYPVYSKYQNGQIVQQPQLTYTYTYDGMGRQYSALNSVTNTSWPASASYGPSDEFLQAFNNIGVPVEQRTYNSMLQATKVNGAQYNYPATGNNGRISSEVDSRGQTLYFSYDSLNRLAAASGNGVGVPTGGAWSESYSYDGFGNLLAKTPAGTAPTLSVNVNLNNQITTQGYDANGNTGGSFDYENRLTTEDLDVYSYGPDNLRIWKVRSDGSQDVYFYDPAGRKLAVYQVSKTSGAQYYIGGGTMIPPEQQPEWFAGIVLGGRDKLGSAGTDAYYPYGEDYPNWAPVTDADNFATYYRDVNTGYDYAKNRYYSNTTGRFLTPDPTNASMNMTNPGSFNRYTYAGNEPINTNDPTGLDGFQDSQCLDPYYATTHAQCQGPGSPYCITHPGDESCNGGCNDPTALPFAPGGGGPGPAPCPPAGGGPPPPPLPPLTCTLYAPHFSPANSNPANGPGGWFVDSMFNFSAYGGVGAYNWTETQNWDNLLWANGTLGYNELGSDPPLFSPPSLPNSVTYKDAPGLADNFMISKTGVYNAIILLTLNVTVYSGKQSCGMSVPWFVDITVVNNIGSGVGGTGFPK